MMCVLGLCSLMYEICVGTGLTIALHVGCVSYYRNLTRNTDLLVLHSRLGFHSGMALSDLPLDHM